MRCIIPKRILKTLLFFSLVSLISFSFSVSALERTTFCSGSTMTSEYSVLCALDSDAITVSNEEYQADEKITQPDTSKKEEMSSGVERSNDDKIIRVLLAVLVILILTTTIIVMIPNRKSKRNHNRDNNNDK